MELYYLTTAFFATGNIILSSIYFFRVRERWRWVKLCYILANFIILLLTLQSVLGVRPAASTQFIGLITLLSSQFAGMVVSLAKVKVAESVEQIVRDNIPR